MTTLQIRIDENTNKKVKKILDDLGMDMSSAIKVYLKQIIVTKGIPFKLLTENGLTVKEEQAILKAAEEAKRGINTTGPMNEKEAIHYLKNLKDAN